MHLRHKVALAATALTLTPMIAVLVPSSPAIAHGTMSDPPSRVYVCKNEGPEAPKSEACKAAVAAGGTQAYYDWNEVAQINAAGQHRSIIPDGQLCSAGRAKYRGLDLARADWPAKRISAGSLTITYHATAPHSNSNFEFYITREGWHPNQGLSWSDLVHIKTFNNQNPTTYTNWTIDIPQRTGRHLIYSIWQRVMGSEEAFYTCSDVEFGDTGPPPPPPPSDPPPPPPPSDPPPTVEPTGDPEPTSPPTAPGGTWAQGTAYQIGDQVTYAGLAYRCRQAHTALPGWEPPNVAALWQPV